MSSLPFFRGCSCSFSRMLLHWSLATRKFIHHFLVFRLMRPSIDYCDVKAIRALHDKQAHLYREELLFINAWCTFLTEIMALTACHILGQKHTATATENASNSSQVVIDIAPSPSDFPFQHLAGLLIFTQEAAANALDVLAHHFPALPKAAKQSALHHVDCPQSLKGGCYAQLTIAELDAFLQTPQVC